MLPSLLMVMVFVVGCTRNNPAATCSNGVCINPDFGFCDSDGAIDGTPGACIAVSCTPASFGACDGSAALTCNAAGSGYDSASCDNGCDPSSGCRMAPPFCSAGAPISCSGGMAVSCNAAGTATEMETCALGCSTSEPRCLTFEPSNGLGPALIDAAGQPDVTLPVGTHINTDTGVVTDGSGTTIAVKAVVVTQNGALPILALEGKSFSMQDVTVSGANPLAFVSHQDITIAGRLSARAHGVNGAPGSQSSASCNGVDQAQYTCTCSSGTCSIGGSGAGNALPGGTGGGLSSAGDPGNGGAAVTSFTPLAGGCHGGSIFDHNNTTLLHSGGGGGGAMQLVSLTQVQLLGGGLIDLGAGGGQPNAGGGSGGLLVVETPTFSIMGSSAGVVANGGAGSGCSMPGPDATLTTTPAISQTCTEYFGGNGGVGSTGAGDACVFQVGGCSLAASVCPITFGGGGGSVGRMHVVTHDTMIHSSGGPIVSVSISTALLIPM